MKNDEHWFWVLAIIFAVVVVVLSVLAMLAGGFYVFGLL